MKKSRKLLYIVIAVLVAAVAVTVIVSVNADTYNLRANIRVHPEMYDKELLSTVSCFNLKEAVSEEVWIECPVDTDEDGKRDLVRIRISRPKGSGENGFKVPVILEYSPYRGSKKEAMAESAANSIESYRTEQYAVGENGVKDTSGAAYADIEYTGITAENWPWSNGAYNKNGINIPASAGAKPKKPANTAASVLGRTPGFHEYMFARGYAVIHASCIGNYYPMEGDEGDMANEGINFVGRPEETVCGMAIIKWLNGKCRAYTDKTRTNEVTATEWCTGKVCMTGGSYVGSLAISVAATGIEGLTCIMPTAAIANWYEYYRNNGGVFGGDNSQGEDTTVLSAFCFSRPYAAGEEDEAVEADYKRVQKELVTQMRIEQDRVTGDYTAFWDGRNSLKTIDKWRAAVLYFEGLNDENVDAVHFDQLYRALKKKDKNYPISLVLHQQEHIQLFNQADGEILKLCHRWLDHYLYGIDNKVPRDEYKVMAVDSSDGSWNKYRSWPVEGTQIKRLYLNNHGLSERAAEAYTEQPIGDSLRYRELSDFCENPADPYYILGDWSSLDSKTREQILEEYKKANGVKRATGLEVPDKYWFDCQGLVDEGWEQDMISIDNIVSHTDARLAYMSEPFEKDMLLSGTSKISLSVTPDKGKGTISAAIVELGEKQRNIIDAPATLLPADEISGMDAWQLKNYTVGDEITPYKIISRGSVDIQNPNKTGKTHLEAGADTAFMPEFYWQTTDIKPGETYNYTFTLEPHQYTINKGSRIAVIIYTTDYRHSIMPEDVTRVELHTGENTFIDLPLKEK